MTPLQDHIALVTGASSGIGRTIALHLASQGADLVVNHLDQPEAAAAVVADIRALGRRAIACHADVTRREDVAALLEQAATLGPVSVLVNNVGSHVEQRAFEDFDDALWQRILDLNLKSAFICTQAVLPGMRARGDGRIVNVSSIAAETGAPFGSTVYAAAKGALNTLTLGLARELGPFGIRVNAVAPGLIDTPFHAGNERSIPQRIATIPLGRMGEPEEVARVVGFLAGDRSRFVTGQIVTVAGGR
ncbi:MAG TPA: SDR family NAD(P)-dependent oxidoreductase [Oscillatoriaceae cyanobacterium]